MSDSKSSADARTVNPFTPLTIKGTVAIVHLNKGKYSTVDLADWPLTLGRRWFATQCGGLAWYAYAHRFGPRKKKLLHQIIFPGQLRVDHKDRNGLNNQRKNLRPAKASQNATNRVSSRKAGYRGVHYIESEGMYRTMVMLHGKQRYGGKYPTAEEAARAYDTMARRYHGEFAVLNFPGEAEVSDVDLREIAHRIRDNWDCGGDGWWGALEELCAVIGRPVEKAIH